MTPAQAMRALLDGLGFPPDPEMNTTPEAFSELLREFLPTPVAPLDVLRTTSGAIVVLRDMPFHSLCAHHLLPFFGSATVAYRPNGKIVGLGAIPRTLATLARRPQLQERLADQIADALDGAVTPAGLVVRLTARQLCVEMRGARCAATADVWVERGEVDPALRALALDGNPAAATTPTERNS